MSWVVEEWKDGLSGKALQKIQEFESQLDKLKKERQQKQFQLESLEAALQKQKQKFDSEKSEVAAIKRENQSLLESCDNLDKTRLKLTHDLQVKEQQVNFLEGQLATSRKQIERLEQELKKHKNDLDKSQISNTSELQPYSTPQKTFTAPATPSYRQHESRLEDLQEKYSHEVEERKRLETELKVLKVKLLNQSSVSHKDIARQQNGSSIFPWQQEQTPSKRRPGAASSMWNTEETPVRPSQQSSFMAQGEATGNSQQAEQLGALNQDLKIKVTELEHRLQAQEKDIKNQMNKFNETQSQLDKAKRDLADKERGLTKSKDDLAKMTTQHEQAVAKCTSMEQKLKQVTEEMNCQRHNSDSTRRTLEQKIKDQEKESQKDLAHLQSSHQALDQQFNQTKTKMSQEIQQAKKEFNVLQSEVDKVTALKNRLEKDMEEQKQRLFKSDQGFQASQTKEMELKKKCDEMQREHNNLSSQLQQGTKRLNQLEEEQKTNEQSLKQSRNMVEDLKAKAEAQSEELKALNKKLECQSQSSSEDIDNLKKTLSAMETKEKLCQEDLNKQKLEVEQLQNKLQALEREKHDLQITTEAAQKEIEEVKQEYEKIVEWKNEKAQLIENTEADRNTMQGKIDELEKSSTTLVDTNNCLQQKLQDLDREKQSQIDSLKGELLNKCMELEEKGRMYDEMLQKYNEADQKHTKDAENTMAQIKMLEDQVKDLEMRVQVETKKTERMEQCHSELLAQYESACDLAKSKDAIIELTQNRIAHLQESASDSDAQQEQLLARFEEEKSNLVKECEESQAVKANEAEQAKLDLIRCEQDILLLQDQVTSLESALKFQKGLSVEVQTKHADLLKVNNDLTQRISEAEKRVEDLLSEVKALSDQVTSLCALKDQCAEFATAAEESKLALENLQDTHKQTVEELQTQKTRLEKFEIQIIEVGDDISSLERENSELTENLERVQKEKEDLSSKYQTISEAHNAICEEKTDLKKQISTISAALAEKVTVVEMLATVKTDLEASNVMCAELKSTVESLQKQHDSVVDHNSNLEKRLEEKTDRIGSLEADVKERSAKFNEAAEAYVAEMEKHLQKHKNLKEQLEVVKAQLQTKCQEADEAEEKLTSCLSEISSLKEDLEVSNAKLKEVSEACDRISQEVLSCKQSASSHAQELETLRGALETSKRSEESKGCEIQTLKSQLREAELEKSKASDAVKEKNISMNKIKVQLEMLQMDLEDNEACITTYDSQIEELKGTVSILEGKFDHCETQKYDLKVALDGARDQLSTKTSEISQLMACLEDTHKQQHNNSALASELQSVQTTNENLKVALEAEVCKCTNIETIHNNLIEQKREVETNLQELQRDYQNALKGLDSLKLKNDSLQEVIQQLTDETQTLKLALEQATQQMEKTSVKNKEFEEEHTKLSHQLVMLQNEQSQFTNQYSQLLSQVVEQQSRIEQLQEVKKHERALNADSAIQQEYTEEENVVDQQPACENLETCTSPVEEITPPLITSADESSETESKALEVSEPVSEVDVHASIEERLQEKSRELEELSHAFEEAVQTLEEQREVQLEQLRDQYTAELQKMDSVKLDLETKLVDERQHIEMLSSQLEVARQQMEELNLASQSLLLDDQENVPQAATADASLAVVKDDRSKAEELDDGEFFDAPGSLNESTIPETVDDDGAGEPLTLDYTPDSPKEQGVSLMELHASKDTIKRQEEGLQELHAQYELLTAEMAIRKELCKEMENKVHELEKEKSESLDKLASANGEKRVLSSQVEAMTEEIDLLKLQQQTSNSQLSDVLEMLEGLEHAKGGWDEKFLQIESELKRTRSEKSNLEKHILSMEVDLESMHEQKQKLETELESSRKTNGSLEQELSNAVTERGQLKQELFSCSEERESENQSLVKMKENAVFLEKNNLDTRELIRILEEDIHAGRKQFEEASNKIDILVKEKEELLEQAQLLEQNIVTLNEEKGQLLTEFGQLKDGENTVLRESESMVSKVHSLQEENAKLSLSLESSLLEKGEIAARLISTQEEVTQMRTGIEKLKVRIESDERKKNHMSQLLKAAQRKADSLQDNIEKLEREREDSDQNFEQVVLQAETTKAELEELEAEKKVLSATIDEMTMKLNNLREEKDRLEKELTLRIEEMQVSMQEVSQKLVSAEQANKDAEINQKNVVDELQSKLGATECALQTCRNELETTQLKEQDATRQLLSLQTANEELEQRLQKAEELQDSLQSVSQSLQNDLAVKRQQQITEREEEKAKLHAQLEELRGLVEEKQQWEEVREQLKAVAAEWEEKAQADSAKNETMQITTASLQSSVKQLETQLEAATVMNAELTEKINASQETNLNLQKELETERSATKDGFQLNLNSLNIQLQESQREAQSYKLSLETLAAEKEELARNLAGIQESLVEMKEREIRLEDALKQAQQQHVDKLTAVREEMAAAESKATELLSDTSSLRAREQELTSALEALQGQHDQCKPTQDELNSKMAKLSKERDGVLSKMNLWMKSCKQLESEKQNLAEENQKQGEQITSLKASQKLAADGDCSVDDQKAELEELREALEEKTKEADDSMDRYCSLMVKVHKLEEANESLQNKVKQLTSQTSASKARKSTSASTQSEDKSSNVENTRPEAREDPEGHASAKRSRALAETPVKAQEALQNLAKRLKAGATPQPRLREEFSPEGLPDRVMKGFADIPKGEMSPFIVRRTAVQRCSPRLAAQNSPVAQQMSFSADQSRCSSKPPAEDSSSQEGLTGGVSSILASVTNSPRPKGPESPAVSMDQRKTRRSSSTRRTSDQHNKRRQTATPAKQDENCHVQ